MARAGSGCEGEGIEHILSASRRRRRWRNRKRGREMHRVVGFGELRMRHYSRTQQPLPFTETLAAAWLADTSVLSHHRQGNVGLSMKLSTTLKEEGVAIAIQSQHRVTVSRTRFLRRYLPLATHVGNGCGSAAPGVGGLATSPSSRSLTIAT